MQDEKKKQYIEPDASRSILLARQTAFLYGNFNVPAHIFKLEFVINIIFWHTRRSCGGREDMSSPPNIEALTVDHCVPPSPYNNVPVENCHLSPGARERFLSW